MLITRLKAFLSGLRLLWYKVSCKRFSWLYGAIRGLKGHRVSVVYCNGWRLGEVVLIVYTIQSLIYLKMGNIDLKISRGNIQFQISPRVLYLYK